MSRRVICVWFLFFSFGLTVVSCAVYHQRFTFGELSPSQSCLVVFPFVDLHDPNDSLNSKDDLLSEYLALSLVHAGLAATMGPRDVDHLFEQAGRQSPAGISQKEAIKLGRSLNAQAVLFGAFSKLPMQSAGTPVDKPDLLVGADVYLIEISSNSIAWLYSSRFYTSEKQYLAELARFSQQITQSLLASGRAIRPVTKEQCWNKENIVKALASGPVSQEKPKSSQVTKPALSAGAAAYFNKLATAKEIVLANPFNGRSTQLNEKSRSTLKEVVQAMLQLPPNSQFMLEGHVDETANRDDDFWVSAQQAGKLRDALGAESDALSSRLQISSKGGSVPTVPNINQKSRERNRRIIITAINPKP